MIYELLTLEELRKYELLLKKANYNSLSVSEKHAIEKIALHYASFHHYSDGAYDLSTPASSDMARIPYEIFFSRPDDKIIDFLLSDNSNMVNGERLKLFNDFNVKSVNDIALVITLYRPGFMDYIPQYLSRKEGKEPVPSVDLHFDEALKDTYGIPLFHEQIIGIIKRYTGYQYDKCGKLFWSIRHKEKNVVEMERKNFVTALAMGKNYSPDFALKLFNLIEENASKTFWKSVAIEEAIYLYTKAYIMYKIFNKEL